MPLLRFTINDYIRIYLSRGHTKERSAFLRHVIHRPIIKSGAAPASRQIIYDHQHQAKNIKINEVVKYISQIKFAVTPPLTS